MNSLDQNTVKKPEDTGEWRTIVPKTSVPKTSKPGNQGKTADKPKTVGRSDLVEKWGNACTIEEMDHSATDILKQWEGGKLDKVEYDQLKECVKMFKQKFSGPGERLPPNPMLMRFPLSSSANSYGSYPISNAMDVAAALMTMDFKGMKKYRDELYCALLFSFGYRAFGNLMMDESKGDYNARVVSRLTITFRDQKGTTTTATIWGTSASGAIGKRNIAGSRADRLKTILEYDPKTRENWVPGNCAEWATFSAAIPDAGGKAEEGKAEGKAKDGKAKDGKAKDGEAVKPAFKDNVTGISTKAWKLMATEITEWEGKTELYSVGLAPVKMCEHCEELSQKFSEHFAPGVKVVDQGA